jgi:hypothetical protein
MDTDIMHIDEVPWPPSNGPCDDITGFLHIYEGDTVDIAWAADNDGFGLHHDGVWDSVSLRSVIGVKVLFPPKPGIQMFYNWWTSNMSGSPQDWGPWRAVNQQRWAAMNPYGSGNLFPGNALGTPGGDVSKYFIMSNQEFDYDQIYSCVWPSLHPEEGWLPPNDSCNDFADGKDIRFLISFGPFDQLGPGESLLCVLAYVIGETLHVDPNNGQNLPNNPDTFYAHLNFSSLVQNAQIAQELYNDNFFVFLPGDVNSNGVVNIEDVVYLLNYVFIGGPPPSPLKSGDVNRDCVVDIEDVVYLINYFFINGPPPQVGCA